MNYKTKIPVQKGVSNTIPFPKKVTGDVKPTVVKASTIPAKMPTLNVSNMPKSAGVKFSNHQK